MPDVLPDAFILNLEDGRPLSEAIKDFFARHGLYALMETRYFRLKEPKDNYSADYKAWLLDGHEIPHIILEYIVKIIEEPLRDLELNSEYKEKEVVKDLKKISAGISLIQEAFAGAVESLFWRLRISENVVFEKKTDTEKVIPNIFRYQDGNIRHISVKEAKTYADIIHKEVYRIIQENQEDSTSKKEIRLNYLREKVKESQIYLIKLIVDEISKKIKEKFGEIPAKMTIEQLKNLDLIDINPELEKDLLSTFIKQTINRYKKEIEEPNPIVQLRQAVCTVLQNLQKRLSRL